MASPTNSESESESINQKVEPYRFLSGKELEDQMIMKKFYDNCAVKSVFSGILGGGMGVLMGFLLGSLDSPLHQDTMTTRQIFKYQFRNIGARSFSSAKTFALLGLVFSGAECVVEKVRAKHDVYNQAIAGCVSGAALSAKGGPKAACMGCAGFSAFSVAIEKFMERHT